MYYYNCIIKSITFILIENVKKVVLYMINVYDNLASNGLFGTLLSL